MRSRQRILRRTLVDSARCDLAQRRLFEILTHDPDFAQAKTVLAYADMADEVPMWPIIRRWKSEKTFLLPAIRQNKLEVRPYVGDQNLSSGELGILESSAPPYASLSEIDLALIPGVAFDIAGHRLGYGKGYYDRFLSHPELRNLLRIGVCFDFQCVDAVPVEIHDVALHRIIIV